MNYAHQRQHSRVFLRVGCSMFDVRCSMLEAGYSVSFRTNPLAGPEVFALPQPRELATPLALVRLCALSARPDDDAGTDRPGKAAPFSIRIQSAIARPRAALRLRVLLLQ